MILIQSYSSPSVMSADYGVLHTAVWARSLTCSAVC